jgi:quinol monooxygenase YgiN
MVTVGLVVRLVAKEGRSSDVAEFLKSALPLVQAEERTPAWFAYQADENTFYITDVFATEMDRQAHLDGPIAAALMANAPELLSQPPEIIPANVLAAKF